MPKLNQCQVNKLNRPITSKKIEAVIKKLLTPKSQRSDDFSAEFYQNFKEEPIPNIIPLKSGKRQGYPLSPYL